MDESVRPKGGEAREFWEAAIRLWNESGLSVREFCRREGLAEHSFYFWRRELLPENPSSGVNRQPLATDGGEVIADQRRTRKRGRMTDTASTDAPAVEFMPVCVVAEDVSRARPMSTEMVAEISSIEIVHRSGWRVRITDGFAPATLAAVLTVLEQRSC